MIYEKGCIQAGEEWMERNLLAIASGAVGTAFAQVRVGERELHWCKCKKGPTFSALIARPTASTAEIYQSD